MLRLFKDLIEMRMQGLWYLNILSSVIVFRAEIKYFFGSRIIEIKKLRILSQAVQDDLTDISEELNTRQDIMFRFHSINFTIC
jgi:hypothetical protein